MSDAELLWTWRNDPAVRASALTTEVVEWRSHLVWLEAKLRSLSTRMWILERDEAPVGQIRYDLDGDAAEIDFSVDAACRGDGLGSEMLRLTSRQACAELGAVRLVGTVRLENLASAATFTRAGFSTQGSCTRHGRRCLLYELSCRSCE